jgi:hypothetical protein
MSKIDLQLSELSCIGQLVPHSSDGRGNSTRMGLIIAAAHSGQSSEHH